MDGQRDSAGIVSLVVAVTGHRDLYPEDVRGLEVQVTSILESLRASYSNTPLLLLSALAEGADRLAVRAAARLGIPYVAVLPMAAEDYRQDFPSEGSDAEFRKLLAGAVRTVELRDPHGWKSPNDPAAARDLRYERLGEFLVNYSQILIAIWDGNRTGKKGGTSDVIALKLGEKRESGRLETFRMNGNGAGPVHKIFTRRISAGAGVTPGVKHFEDHPAGTKAKSFEASYRLLDSYNGDVREFGQTLAPAVEKSRKELFAGAEPSGLTPAMEWVATTYAHADVLAIHFASFSILLWRVVFLFLGVAGVAMSCIHSLESHGWVLLTYYVFIAAAFGVGHWEVRKRRRDRHEDYRALAEALRVQFFWMAAGLPDVAAENYLRKQAGDMVWIRDAMSESGLFENGPGAESGVSGPRLALARGWLETQEEYFLKRTKKYEASKNALDIFAIFAAGVGLAAPLAGLYEKSLQHEDLEKYFHAASGIGMWWAALAWNYSERRGFVQEMRQYARMYELFHNAAEDIGKYEKEGSEESLRRAEETLRSLGREALTENGDWLAMHRERKLTTGLGTG